jgi:hypothetical protein
VAVAFGAPLVCSAEGCSSMATDQLMGPVVAIVEQTSTDGPGTTYRLSLILSSSAKNVYTIYGDGTSAMSIPAAYQSDAPYGADIGGVSASYVGAVPTTAYDSWLSVGPTDGDNYYSISSIGIDFDAWTADSGLTVHNGAVFWMAPNDGPSDSAVIAQVTVSGAFTATVSAQGRSTSATDGDWQQAGLTFST